MSPDFRRERQDALRAALVREGLDALLVTHLANIRYLTGFTGSAGLLLVRPTDAVLITDFRYATQAPQEAGSAASVEIDRASVWQRLAKLLAGFSPATLGIEAHAMT
ncbi:MAG: aminopeptidase P family N-terminal domain-containing protein, partial [Gemmatimonadales bacterium]